MTLVEDRAALDDVPAPPSGPPVARSTSSASSWRFAARLARREVRRRPGRTALVMLLVALPVFAMSVASIAARTNDADNAGWYERSYGDSDIALYDARQIEFVDGVESSPVDPDRLFSDGPTLPGGSRTLSYTETWTLITGENADGLVVRPSVHLVIVDASDPMLAPVYRIDRGRAASEPGEVMLSKDLAARFGVDVGGTLTLTRPDFTATVVGIHAESQWLSTWSMVAPGLDPAQIRRDAATVRRLIDLPPSADDAQTARLVQDLRVQGFAAQSPNDRGYDEGGVSTEQLAWAWVAGVVAFIAVGIVIASAFATSARRQLATVGQLSANGASQRLIRRTLGLQGMWTGVLGAALGLGAGVTAVLAAHRWGWGETFSGRSIGPLRIAPLDLVVVVLTAVTAATIAARVPARSAARIPVLSALAGRRPVSAPPRWLVPVGIGLFGFGVFLIAAAASTPDGGNFSAAIAVLGALGVLFGMVCGSPLIVAWISDVGSRRGGVTRLAARSLGRSRMRSAGVLTAIATVSALSIAGLTAVDAVRVADQDYEVVADDLSVITLWYADDAYVDGFDEVGNLDPDFDPAPMIIPPVPTALTDQFKAVLPAAQLYPITAVVPDELSQRDYERTPAQDRPVTVPTIADESTLSLLDLTDAQLEQLATTGTLSVSNFLQGEVLVSSNGRLVAIDVGPPLAIVDGSPPAASQFQTDVLITPEFAAQQGFDTQVSRVMIVNPTDLTAAERDALNEFGGFGGYDAFIDGDRPGATSWYFYVPSPSNELPWAAIQLGVLGAALLMVLLVVAIGLSLAATESRDERDVLHTVGAPPRTLRRVAAAKAWVLTTGAAVIAIPAGYTVIRVITWVNEQTAPFPIVGALGLLVVIPALAWAATLAVSAIAQKFRPIQISTITLD